MEKKYISNHGLGEFEADEQTVRVCWTLYRSEKDWKNKNGLVFHSYKELTKFIRLRFILVYEQENIRNRSVNSTDFFRIF